MFNDSPLSDTDPEIHLLIEREKHRQKSSIELIASENFTSRSVMTCLGSILTNKYSEGQPGARYYGGNEFIDDIEILCKKRALEAFNISSEEWAVNVQPYSGSPANFAAYTAFLKPHDRIMGLDLPSGGHLSHGYFNKAKKVSATSVYFESFPYVVDHETGLIDYEYLEKTAKSFLPKMIIAGASAYPRDIDFSKFRTICDSIGALLLVDMAHISGIVAAGNILSNPFKYADIVTSTSHKTLRGPRAGLIFTNIKRLGDGARVSVDSSVFPALQGGPHNHQIAALATQLLEVKSSDWKVYVEAVVNNCQSFCAEMTRLGYKIVTGGSDNHLCLVDLRPVGLSGSKAEKICDAVLISLNRNTVHGDVSALTPGGVRIGTSAMTTRGASKTDFLQIAKFFDKAIQLGLKAQSKSPSKKLVDFEQILLTDEEIVADLKSLRSQVEKFAINMPFPGLS